MFNISKVEKDDIYEVKKLLSNVWADTYKSILSKEAINKFTNIWHNPKLLESQCESKNTLFVIAKEDTQRIIGLATGNLIDDKTLNLIRLYIAKEYQRVGIGSLLLNDVMDEFP